MTVADNYFEKLPHVIRESCYAYSGKTLLEKMEEGYERHYIKLVAYTGANNSKEAYGMACINVDVN